MRKKRNNTRIFIRLEKNGKYIQKRLTKRMICALFDLQYMMDEAWDTIELNKMDKELGDFFKIVEQIDEAMHKPVLYSFTSAKHHVGRDKKGKLQIINRKSKRIETKMEGDDFTYGKPKWKKIENENQNSYRKRQ